MTVLPFVTAVIFGLMLAEARVSRQHEARLIARGAIAAPEPGYVVMSVLYPSCFFAMGAEGVVRQAGVSGMFVSGALMFAAAKFLKYWAIGYARRALDLPCVSGPGRAARVVGAVSLRDTSKLCRRCGRVDWRRDDDRSARDRPSSGVIVRGGVVASYRV